MDGVFISIFFFNRSTCDEFPTHTSYLLIVTPNDLMRRDRLETVMYIIITLSRRKREAAGSLKYSKRPDF